MRSKPRFPKFLTRPGCVRRASGPGRHGDAGQLLVSSRSTSGPVHRSVSRLEESIMRICYSAVYLLFLAGFLQAQTKSFNEPFLLASPRIVTRIEKFEPFSSPAMSGWVTRIAADRKGFVWCATGGGVARFDGYDLKIYPENLADTAGVVRAQMQAIAIDGDIFVWGATSDGGLKRLDPVTDLMLPKRNLPSMYITRHGRKDRVTTIAGGSHVLRRDRRA